MMNLSKKIILIFRARLHRNHKFCQTSQREIPPSCTLHGLDFRCLSREQSVQPQKNSIVKSQQFWQMNTTWLVI